MDDDEDHIVSERLIEPVFCQICQTPLNDVTAAGRQAHYEGHFSDSDGASNSRAGPSNVIDLFRHAGTSKESGRGSKVTPSKQDTFWHRSQDGRPPKNFTPGLIPILKQALFQSHAKGQTVRAALCYDGMVHVATEYWDMGWGCGYLNFLMACTALIDQQVQPMYFPALDQPTPPGVRNLQRWIEDAWNAGYDPEGAAELKQKLIGTKKWIGTAELYVAFLYRGIPSRLVDFPRVERSADAVIRWIENYFTSPLPPGTKSMHAKIKATVDEALRGASPIVVTDRMPLVLQHEGHSRTIVGFERLKNGSVNLLCFDPSKKPNQKVREAAITSFQSTKGSPPSSPSQRQHHSLSPSKIINHVFHPRHRVSDQSSGSESMAVKKRRATEIEREDHGRDSKRVRGGRKLRKNIISLLDDSPEAEPGVEIVGTTAAPARIARQKSLVDHEYGKILDFFRLKPKKVGQKDRYQILYFPLEDVLTQDERWARRVVTSETVQ